MTLNLKHVILFVVLVWRSVVNKIMISVIVPVFNVGNYLSDCLNSLLLQDCADIEIICIDDGSTDNSAMILKKFADSDSRIKIMTQKNQGVGKARNTGLSAAAGEYVCFVDPDDFVTPNYLSGLLRAVCSGPYDIAANENIINYYEKRCSCNKQIKPRFSGEVSVNRNTLGRRCGRVVCWNKIYRRKFLEEKQIVFPDCRLAEDQYFYFVCMMNAAKVVFSDEGIYFYRQRDDSLVGQMKKSLTTNDHLQVARRIFDYCLETSRIGDFYFPLSLLKTHLRMSRDKKKAFDDVRCLLKELKSNGIVIRPKDRFWAFCIVYLPFRP